MMQDFNDIINKTRCLLNQNQEWRCRYKGYAEKITRNKGFIKSVRQSFHQWHPLTVYINTTSAQKAANKVSFDLRYYGQNVAKLTGSASGNLTLSTRGFDANNRRDFCCVIQLNDVDWAGSEAAEFRRYFKDRIGPRNNVKNIGNEEHRLESLWLTELQKQSEKALPNTKAVEIGGVRYPFPTPISASIPNSINYSSFHGGGIDILARTGTGGINTYLCVIEFLFRTFIKKMK